MSKSGFGVKEARIKPSREQVNLCGACGSEISATELLCKECRGTMGPVIITSNELVSDRRFGEGWDG